MLLIIGNAEQIIITKIAANFYLVDLQNLYFMKVDSKRKDSWIYLF